MSDLRPLRVCTHCVHHARKVNDTHEELKHESNHIYGKERCLDVLSHRDVLEVVEDVLEAAIGKNRYIHCWASRHSLGLLT